MQNAEVMVLRRRCMAFEVTSQVSSYFWRNYICTLLKLFVQPSVETILVELFIFQVKQTKFREMFRATAPFSYNAVHPYINLEKVGV